jgi:dihydrodiol dehydrogenase / D-xylose 1-dehydrogenase (NADP)
MIRFSAIGLGTISHTFAKEFEYITGGTIVACGSRDISKAKEFAEQYNIPSFGDYDHAVYHENVDCVYIGTPHNHHFEWAKKALEAGKHVFCEKPITVNAAELRELLEIQAEKKVFLMDAMWTYFLPGTVQAKKWVDEGKIGEVKFVSIDFSYPAKYDLEGRLYNANLAGGALLDIGVYPIYTTFHFLGHNYNAMHCFGEVGPTGVDEATSIMMDYENAKANLYCSIKMRTRNEAAIFGTKGHVRIPLFWMNKGAQLYNIENELVEDYKDTHPCHGFKWETEHVIDCINKGLTESPIVPLERTLAVMDTMDIVRDRIGLKYPFE